MIVRGQLLLDPSRSPEPGWIRIESGRIAHVALGDRVPDSELGDAPPLGGSRSLISPAFYDAHTHLPQIDSIGCDGMHLLDWLDRVIFPAEGWWGRGGAKSMTRRATRAMLSQGTAGFAGFLTSHGEVNREVLAQLAFETPMRFRAGRAVMDRHAPSDLVREDFERGSEQPSRSVLLPGVKELDPARGGAHAGTSLSPRFAVSCSEALLAECGWCAKETPGLLVQTHLAESVEEVARVRQLFPDDEHYTGVYDRLGLLGESTLLAHCVHLSDAEFALIAERACTAVHCPGANIFLEAGLFDLRRAHDAGVLVALGSDVAAGPDVAMPRVARQMIEVAKCRRLGGDARAAVPTPAEAWRIITEVNARAIGLEGCGRIEVGAHADLLVLDVPEAWADDHLIGRLLYQWDSSLIDAMLVCGARTDRPVPARG
ncbi:MAG: amidohydrolase family protein [Planctomycetota bacterium]